MTALKDTFTLKSKTVKNRILLPPLVCFNWADELGYETVSRALHYGRRAAGGAGIIVIEATAIVPEGRLATTELGLWEDGHIPQFTAIAEACKPHNSLSLVQLVHAGDKSIGEQKLGASELSILQINQIQAAFVAAAIRAQKAGLDGVEIHGAHGYLLSQFASLKSNTRTDAYGGSLENRMRFALEVVRAVREAVGNDFLIAYRYGVNDPTFASDRIFVSALEEASVDFLNVSSGILEGDLEAPEGFPYAAITYMGTVIKQTARVPVACVFGIRDPKDAHFLVENQLCDVVAVGRGLLADPQWGNKALSGQEVNRCYHCKPRCFYGVDGRTCPWEKSYTTN